MKLCLNIRPRGPEECCKIRTVLQPRTVCSTSTRYRYRRVLCSDGDFENAAVYDAEDVKNGGISVEHQKSIKSRGK